MGDDNTYEFEHILVRDAVYRRLLKRTRSQLHERFAAWADRVNGDRAAEFAEITAYHLEQAHRYLAELGPLDDHGRDARRCARLSGWPAPASAPSPVATCTLRPACCGRAVDLMPEYDPDRLGLLPDLGEALMDLGEFGRAEEVLVGALAAADAIGDHRLAGRGHPRPAARAAVRRGGRMGGARAGRGRARDRRVFELVGDNVGPRQGLAHHRLGARDRACATAMRPTAVQRAIECARLAGDGGQERRNAGALTMACVYGPMPVASRDRALP